MRRNDSGLTLVEMLACLGVVAVLASMGYVGFSNAIHRSRSVECMSKLRAIGQAVHLYTLDNDGKFPRSSHSAGANREPGWAASISPYLTAAGSSRSANWSSTFESYFRCPEDRKSARESNNNPNLIVVGGSTPKYSYGLNVHFELNPDGDDYIGSPAVWRRMFQVPRPSQTIMVAETKPGSYNDHFMCHQWSGAAAAKNVVGYKQHLNRSNFLFVDGHVEHLPIEETIDFGNNVNLWNPELAR